MSASLARYMATAAETLIAGRTLRGESKLRTTAAIGHAVAFSTWKSLVREARLNDATAVELMCGLVGMATQGSGRAAGR
jgi:hypothetical protein